MEKKKFLEPENCTELERQKRFMAQIRVYNEALVKETGRERYYYNLTMGCQMNTHDSEKLAGMLTEMGYKETNDESIADFIVYNTCCVRENAELKVYGKLGWLKHHKSLNPNALIVLCGCMMQQETVIEKIKKSFKQVDIVLGTFNLYKLPELICTRLETGVTVFDIWSEHKDEIVEDLPSIRDYAFKASVNIMFGCDNFCSYCIVPYVRGRERSRLPKDIIREIKDLAADGVREITLLGQNVNSYGKNLEEPMSFATLLGLINSIDGIDRIQFMTSHPKDLSPELIEAMKNCDKVCSYLHLPFQSGSNTILQKMNRRYTKEQYLSLVENIRKEIPDILLSTDIIVGFPGETEEDFMETLDVIDKVRFSMAYTFIYSKRTGTPAARMDCQIPEDIIKERFKRLMEHVNDSAYGVLRTQVGKICSVLAEEPSKNNSSIITGRTEHNSLVHFKGDRSLIGQIIPVKIIDNKTFYLIGERV